MSLFGDIFSGVSDLFTREDDQRKNKHAVENQQFFQQQMSDSSYQRAATDLKKAGINPILAGQFGGASTPAGAMRTATSAPNHTSWGSSAKTMQDTKKSKQETSLIKLKKALASLELELKEPLKKGADSAAIITNNVNKGVSAIEHMLTTYGPSPKDALEGITDFLGKWMYNGMAKTPNFIKLVQDAVNVNTKMDQTSKGYLQKIIQQYLKTGGLK